MKLMGIRFRMDKRKYYFTQKVIKTCTQTLDPRARRQHYEKASTFDFQEFKKATWRAQDALTHLWAVIAVNGQPFSFMDNVAFHQLQ